MHGNKQHNKVVGVITISTTNEKRAYHEGIKCSPHEAMFGVPMKLGIAKSVLQQNLTINMTTDEDLEKVININNECTGDIEDEHTAHEPTLDLQLQGNDNTSETETNVTMEVETEIQNRKIDPEAKPLTGQLRLSAELKK